MRGGMFADLGRTLRVLRESLGLAQAELARKAGMGKSQVSKYERGKELPQLASLEKLLAALGQFLETFEILLRARLLEAGGDSEARGQAAS